MSNLYTVVKDRVQGIKSVIADDQLLVLNRKDFLFTQISPINGYLQVLGARTTYAFRLYLNMLELVSTAVPKESPVTIYVSDDSLTLAAFYLWIRLGASRSGSIIISPRGIAKIEPKSKLTADFADSFYSNLSSTEKTSDLLDCDGAFVFVLGNSKTTEQSVHAADSFAQVKKGFLAVKDFSKVGNFDEREYFESRGIFLTVSLEGHGYNLKL
jgi:hypothetical protein